MTMFRLYFNRCEDFPQIWSIDSGDSSTELNVIGWRIEPGCVANAGRAPDFAVVDSTREPKAWVEVLAHTLRIDSGMAVFEAESFSISNAVDKLRSRSPASRSDKAIKTLDNWQNPYREISRYDLFGPAPALDEWEADLRAWAEWVAKTPTHAGTRRS